MLYVATLFMKKTPTIITKKESKKIIPFLKFMIKPIVYLLIINIILNNIKNYITQEIIELGLTK